ncbi:substrate-binding domain-containing protein [Bradyrhizobium sp. RDT10]
MAAGGHRRFAFMAGLENSSTSRDREKAFTGWLAEHGFAAPQRAIGNYDFATTMQATRDLLGGKGSRPDAIFCANDHTAIAVLEVIRHELGLRVPEDISVIGFDDVGAARWPSFSLTSYAQPINPMVEGVVDIITSLLDSPRRDPGTCGCPANWWCAAPPAALQAASPLTAALSGGPDAETGLRRQPSHAYVCNPRWTYVQPWLIQTGSRATTARTP